MILTNINGTSQLTCSCGSWLRHWEIFSGQTTEFCQALGCNRKDVLGAHVQLAGGNDKWYIYPLCNLHNQHDGLLWVSDAYRLVSANTRETCERAATGYSYRSPWQR